MHSDLSPHLHTPECNVIIQQYLQCQKDNPWRRYLGECTRLDTLMTRCLKKEKLAFRQENHRKSNELKKIIAEKQKRQAAETQS